MASRGAGFEDLPVEIQMMILSKLPKDMIRSRRVNKGMRGRVDRNQRARCLRPLTDAEWAKAVWKTYNHDIEPALAYTFHSGQWHGILSLPGRFVVNNVMTRSPHDPYQPVIARSEEELAQLAKEGKVLWHDTKAGRALARHLIEPERGIALSGVAKGRKALAKAVSGEAFFSDNGRITFRDRRTGALKK